MAGRAGRFARLSLMSRPDQLAVSPMGHSNEGTKSLVLVFVGLIVAEYLKIQSPLPEESAWALGLAAGLVATQVIPPRVRWARILLGVLAMPVGALALHAIKAFLKGR
ncbi:hypothetical protein [Paludibaculum fermentans]|uniref:Uncharacterized protein n=1 Tax=Paludibaculum fermentans TaxID=1473598 RepID=A0A7S7NV08_PALFE|nr:hypothetical protein [Paludibaculum fermentans]QOY90259.1 hypothetical protein IRI77_09980 [Paludibaculum fermentans]